MPPQITLIVSDDQGQSQTVVVESNRFTIGRSQDNDLVIQDKGVSRRQALIECYDGVAQISDCGSQSGTYVNGVTVSGASALQDGDVISMGIACEIQVRIAAPDSAASPQAPQPDRRAETSAAILAAQPHFLTYAALTKTDGGQQGDPVVTAWAMLPDLVAVRIHFGGGAESSLLVLAAYTMGPGTKKSHPLLPTIRRRVQNNPGAKRNVWYLYERNGLDREAYHFVVRFLAFGVIAQNPRRFGIQADPITF